MSAPGPGHAGTSGGNRPRPAANSPNMRNTTSPYPVPSGQQFRDTNVHLSSYAPMFGAITNNNNFDSSLSQPHQGAYSPNATQQFSFSPGSQATFSIQHNSGNGALHQPVYQAPVEADPEADDKAYLSIWKELINDPDDSDNEGNSSSKNAPGKLAESMNNLQTQGVYSTASQQPLEQVRDIIHLQGTVPASFSGQTWTLAHNNSVLPPSYPHPQYHCPQYQQQPSPFNPNSFSPPPYEFSQ